MPRYESRKIEANSGGDGGRDLREDPVLLRRETELEAQGYKVGLFWVPSHKIPTLQREVERLQKRTRRLKLKPIVLELGKPYFTKVKSTKTYITEGAFAGKEQHSETEYVNAEVTPVLVAGEEPRLRGWRLIAVLDYDEEGVHGGAWVRVLPGEVMPAEFRTVDPTRCDHCRTKRDRTTVFVLGHDDGRYAVVGRTCLLDFLGGHGDPLTAAAASETLFALFDMTRGMEDWGGEGMGGRAVLAAPIEEFFALVVRLITDNGWMSRSVARDRMTGPAATATVAWNVTFPFDPKTRELAGKIKTSITDEDRATAEKVIDWATKEFVDIADTNQLSDYGYNARMAMMSGMVTERSAGIVASLVPGYQRAMGRAAEKAASAGSEHFGAEGERVVLDLTFTGVRTIDGQYGTTYLCMFLTPEGNVAKWFASNWIFDFPVMDAVGKKVRLKATIKGHGEYKGAKETMLSRAAIVGPEEEAKPKKRTSRKKTDTTPAESSAPAYGDTWHINVGVEGRERFVTGAYRRAGEMNWTDFKGRASDDTKLREKIREYIRMNLDSTANIVDDVTVTRNSSRSDDASPEQVAEAMRVIARDEYDGDRMHINGKRSSRRRTSRPPLQQNRAGEFRARPGGGVMSRGFGKPIDPDRVEGSQGRQLDAALDRYETFHKKKPIDVVRIKHAPPAQLCEIGDALSVSYRTDKWYEDGKDIDYKHVHDPEDGVHKRYEMGSGVRWYENARTASPEERARGTCKPPRAYPEAWTRLGMFLGSFCRRDDDGEVAEVDASKSARECWLLCAPDGKMLAIYSPEPQSDGSVGFLAIACGGKLDVIEDGIVG